MFKNGLHGKPSKRKNSQKHCIPQTIFECDENSRLWNNEYERTSNWIQSKIKVSFMQQLSLDVLVLNQFYKIIVLISGNTKQKYRWPFGRTV